MADPIPSPPPKRTRRSRAVDPAMDATVRIAALLKPLAPGDREKVLRAVDALVGPLFANLPMRPKNPESTLPDVPRAGPAIPPAAPRPSPTAA